VDFNRIAAGKKPWRRVPLVPGESYHSLNLWNGRDEPESCGLSIHIYDPSGDADMFLLSGLNTGFLRSAGFPWKGMLDSARLLSEKLGGLTIVSSHELCEDSSKKNIPHSDEAAYAAFWGEDRSGCNSLYRRLRQFAAKVPFASVVAETWAEVEAPDETRLRELIGILSPEGTAGR